MYFQDLPIKIRKELQGIEGKYHKITLYYSIKNKLTILTIQTYWAKVAKLIVSSCLLQNIVGQLCETIKKCCNDELVEILEADDDKAHYPFVIK